MVRWLFDHAGPAVEAAGLVSLVILVDRSGGPAAQALAIPTGVVIMLRGARWFAG